MVGTRTLLEGASVEPAKLTMRALFELMLATRYLIHGGRRRIDHSTPTSEEGRTIRARYYAAAAIRARIYRRQAVRDGVWGGSLGKGGPKLDAEIKKYKLLLSEEFPAQQERFGPLRCYTKGKRRPRYHDDLQWFSFGFRKRKINSVRALAYHFGIGQQYEILYAATSALTHPKSYEQDFEIVGDRVDIYSPYMAEAFDMVCFYTLSYAMLTMMWVTKAYAPGASADVQAVSTRVRKLTDTLSADIPSGFME
jgi:hypothetical protein